MWDCKNIENVVFEMKVMRKSRSDIWRGPLSIILTILVLLNVGCRSVGRESNKLLDVNASSESNAISGVRVVDVVNEVDISELHDEILRDHKVLMVEGGDLSGDRESNVIVDIGFGSREYYGVTNAFGQLVEVFAEQLILQNEVLEKVTSEGRYYADEAKVPGTERSDLDEGHVIM